MYLFFMGLLHFYYVADTILDTSDKAMNKHTQ